MSGQFVDDKLGVYRPSYRTIAFCSNTDSQSPIDFYFPDGEVISAADCAPTPEPCLGWVTRSFHHFARQLGRPWCVVHGDYFSVREWQPKPEHLSAIQNNGLHLFMYEPLFIYNNDRSWPWNAKSGPPRYYELEALCDFAKKHQLEGMITVFLGEYGLGAHLQEQGLFKEVRFLDFNTYFQEAVEIELQYKWPTLPPDHITHKYISLNFRYEPIREMLTGFLFGRKHNESGFTSFYHYHDQQEFLKRLPFDPTHISCWDVIQKGILQMQTQLPLTLDAINPKLSDPILESIPDISGDRNVKNLGVVKQEFFPKVFAFVFCESRPFSPRSEMSEKTLQPLFCKKPFLIFSGPKYLEHMRDLGFKTFSDYWDESFDQIEDPQRRFEAFLKTVDSVLSQDLSVLKAMLQDMQPLLDHNKEWITQKVIQFQQDSVTKILRQKS